MKKLILILSLLSYSQTSLTLEKIKISQKVNQSNLYYSLGAGFPGIFSIQPIGYRIQFDHSGIDLGLGLIPLVFVMEGHVYLNYLFFPKPNIKSQAYFGLGAQAGYGSYTTDFNHWKKLTEYIRPQLVFGKEYLLNEHEKRFIQIELGLLFYSDSKHRKIKINKYFPSFSFTYGIRF